MNFTLTFEESPKEIAYIRGGMYNDEIIYLHSPDDKIIKKCTKKCKHESCKGTGCEECEGSGCNTCGKEKKLKKTNGKYKEDSSDVLIDNYFKFIKGRLSYIDINKIQDCVKYGQTPAEERLRPVYAGAVGTINERRNKEIIIHDGNCVPMWNKSLERQILYVTGMSGSGKSSYVGMCINSYHKQYKGHKCYVFSNKTEDPALDKEKIIRIKIDEELIEDPLTLDELKNCLVIFDDIELMANKQLNQEINRLAELIMNQGRSYKIHFIYVQHQANNYKQTRPILNEMHGITIFPSMGSNYSMNYLLSKYFGFNKKQIDKLIHLPSRWVTIYKAPMICLHEKGCYLI